MAKLIISARFAATPEAVFAFHADPANLPRLSVPPGRFYLVSGERPARAGDLQIFRIGWGPFTRPWHARIAALDPGRSITDMQEAGPFRAWRHSHVVWPDGAGTLLVDYIEFESGGGVLGRLADQLLLIPALRLAFAYRRRKTRRLLGG